MPSIWFESEESVAQDEENDNSEKAIGFMKN